MSDARRGHLARFRAKRAGGNPAAVVLPRFSLRQLAYFVAAGETCSMTSAAVRLHISPASVSSAVGHLETDFGVQLFVRHHAQGLSLTPEGSQFLTAARDFLRQSEGLSEVANELSATMSGGLAIGSFRTFSSLIVPEVCRSFLDQHPRVHLSIFEGDESQIISHLKRGDISLALSYKTSVPEELSFEPLAELPTYVLLPADHPLVARRSVALADLIDIPFVLLDMPLTRDYFLAMFERERLVPKVVASSEYPETVRSYVASGFGFSLATARPRAMIAANGLPVAYLRLEGGFPAMVLGMTSRRDTKRNRAQEAFEMHCRQIIAPGRIPGMADWD
jgi:DNA-binding transcriptional LysR family regulator